MNELPKALFVSGTDTDVGKTVVTAALSLFLKQRGYRVGVIKPFQTGTELNTPLDMEYVYKVIDQDYDLEEVCPSRLIKPMAPYSASRFENKEIDTEGILEKTNRFISKNDITIIEGAGGLYVPVKENYIIADFIVELGFPMLLVSRPDLGTINHTMLSIEYAEKRNIDLFGIFINKIPDPPGYIALDNIKLFKSLYNLNLVGILPELEGIDLCRGLFDLSGRNIADYFSESIGGNFKYEDYVKIN